MSNIFANYKRKRMLRRWLKKCKKKGYFLKYDFEKFYFSSPSYLAKANSHRRAVAFNKIIRKGEREMKFKHNDRVRVKRGILKGEESTISQINHTHGLYSLRGFTGSFTESDLESVGLKLKDILTEENRGKTFRRKSDGTELSINESGLLDWGRRPSYLDINKEWEEVKQPVDFMTAFKAWRNGRTIVCKMPGYSWTVRGEDSDAKFDDKEISDGKWYIEE